MPSFAGVLFSVLAVMAGYGCAAQGINEDAQGGRQGIGLPNYGSGGIPGGQGLQGGLRGDPRVQGSGSSSGISGLPGLVPSNVPSNVPGAFQNFPAFGRNPSAQGREGLSNSASGHPGLGNFPGQLGIGSYPTFGGSGRLPGFGDLPGLGGFGSRPGFGGMPGLGGTGGMPGLGNFGGVPGLLGIPRPFA